MLKYWSAPDPSSADAASSNGHVTSTTNPVRFVFLNQNHQYSSSSSFGIWIHYLMNQLFHHQYLILNKYLQQPGGQMPPRMKTIIKIQEITYLMIQQLIVINLDGILLVKEKQRFHFVFDIFHP